MKLVTTALMALVLAGCAEWFVSTPSSELVPYVDPQSIESYAKYDKDLAECQEQSTGNAVYWQGKPTKLLLRTEEERYWIIARCLSYRGYAVLY